MVRHKFYKTRARKALSLCGLTRKAWVKDCRRWQNF